MNKYIVSIFVLFLMLKIYAYEGRPVYDEDGNKTDLINYNPDPNGEPWLGGGMTQESAETRERLNKMPTLPSRNYKRDGSLPEEVILIDNDEFPPVFAQVGGSCAQASGVAYTYSYQLNVLNGVYATAENTRAYGYTHNFLNDGTKSKGSWYWDGWEILTNHGAPDVETFHGAANGGLNGTRWMNGADRWHKANFNRAVKYERIEINSLADIEKIKSWMYDLNGTDPYKKGGCVVFAANSGSASPNGTVSSGEYAKEALSTGLMGAGMDHAMTFAGYSDNVEGGALLLLNSWGKTWATNGYTWVPYTTVVNGGLHKNEVWCVTVGEFDPKYEIKAKISCSSRSGINIKTGFSNGVTETPNSIKTYGSAFVNSGGSYPMEGYTGSNTIEVSLDVSEYLDSISSNKSTFFLQITGVSSSATVEEVSLVDYTGIEIVEIAAVGKSVSAGGIINIPISYTMSGKRYLIEGRDHGNGSIAPSGNKMIDSGATYTYLFTPDKWYKVDSVIIDNENVGAVSEYTFESVSENHTVDAYFSWDPNSPNIYSFTVKNTEYGSIQPGTNLKVEEGSDTVFEIVPEEWHYVDSVLVDGINRGPLVSAKFTHIMNNHEIKPFFSEDGYPGEYEIWNSSKTYAQDKIVSYKGHLWKAKWWANAGDEPGVANMWQDLGEEVIDQKDTLHIAYMEHKSNNARIDTIIITYLAIFKGDTVTTTEVIADGAVAKIGQKDIINEIKFYPAMKKISIPQKGVYRFRIYDLRGRIIRNVNLESKGKGVISIPVNMNMLARGMYLIELVKKGDKSINFREQMLLQ